MTNTQATGLAAAMILTRPPDGWDATEQRTFDSCFERGREHNDAVVRSIIERAEKDEHFKRRVKAAGFGYWLEPGYMFEGHLKGDQT